MPSAGSWYLSTTRVVFKTSSFSSSNMSDTHYTDAGHSRSSGDTSESIEMESLEELAITPDPRLHKHEEFGHQDYENDSGEEDEALLMPRERTTRNVTEGKAAEKASVWVQARRIVIEVFMPSGGSHITR